MSIPLRLAAVALVAAALAPASRYVVGQSYAFSGRLELGQVTDPSYYLALPCGGGPGSGSSRHSFSFRLQPVEHGPDIAGVFAHLAPGQQVEAQGVYRGLVAVPGVSGPAQPTLTCERLTPLPLHERSALFSDLYRLRRE